MALSSSTVLLIGVLGLLGVGLYGLLILRNLIQLTIALQILAKSAMLALVVAGQISGRLNLGQSLAVTVAVADTVVVVVALALAVQVRRRLGSLDVKELSSLRG